MSWYERGFAKGYLYNILYLLDNELDRRVEYLYILLIVYDLSMALLLLLAKDITDKISKYFDKLRYTFKNDLYS